MRSTVNKKDFRGAFKLHKQFREPVKNAPVKVRKIKIDIPTALMVMGTVESISYRTTHKGVVHLYKHDFSPGSRPLLGAGPRRNQVFLCGGRYHVTDRGIVDIDAQGREIDDPAHGQDLPDGEE